MSTQDSYYKDFAVLAPFTNVKYTTSGTSDTYQATGVAIGKLHEFTSGVDSIVLTGTGASVSAATGRFVKAGAAFYWRPTSTKESLGFKSADGTTAYSGSIPACINYFPIITDP